MEHQRISEPIGQWLLRKKLITQEQLNTALASQKQTKEMLGTTLIKMNLIKEDVFLSLLGVELGVPYIDLKDFSIDKEVLHKIPARIATAYKIIPIELHNDILVIATSQPQDIDLQDRIAMLVPFKIRMVVAREKDILEAIRKHYGVGAETIERIIDESDLPGAGHDLRIEDIKEIESEATISRFVNQILMEAYTDRATDIHIEPFEKDLIIRYRIDGVLYDIKAPLNLRHFKDAINARIKVLSNLNIAEKRLPQDGRFKVKIGTTELDLRVSFLPSAFGESVVIRILNSAKLYDMEELGLSPDELKILDELLKKPNGIIFLTGPTGSGKTTTLYSCLSRINQPDKKILTIEDPVEYLLHGISQIQVNPSIGLSFAKGLRSMLRHDPDIMMVGEVRDLETAEISIQIALTGHLIFSTLHTNDAASGVTRLVDMGVEAYLVASAVKCFIAQRLVRLLCPHCKKPGVFRPEDIKQFQSEGKFLPKDFIVYDAVGCPQCKMTGYRGREAIYEFLLVDQAIAELVLSKAPANHITAAAVKSGMRTLRQNGWEKVVKGLTTPAEVARVTQEGF